MAKSFISSGVNHKRASLFVGILLLIGDLFVIICSFYLASQIRIYLIPIMGGEIYWKVYMPIIYLCLLYVFVLFYWNDLYPGYGITAVKEIERTSKLLTMVFLFLGGTTYFLNAFEEFPRSIFFITWVFSIVLIPMLRVLIRNIIHQYSWYGTPILLITDGTNINSIFSALKNCKRMGWKPIAVYTERLNGLSSGDISIPVFSSWNQFLKLKKKFGVNIAIFSAEHNPENLNRLYRISEEFKTVTLMIPYFNLGSLWVKPRDLEGHLGLEITYHLLDGGSRIIKRLIDIFGSIILIILLSPLFLLFYLLIVIESSRPAFFLQERLGKDNKKYYAIKFRTMIINADEELESYLEDNPSARIEYEKFHKLSCDPRVLRVGRFMRKYSLDELPQLWNVLRGEMSLIGPRAYMVSEKDAIGDLSEIILRVRPGMSGWWQVMGRNKSTFENRLKMDQYYISNWSLWLDAYIFMKTFYVVLSGTGT